MLWLKVAGIGGVSFERFFVLNSCPIYYFLVDLSVFPVLLFRMGDVAKW